MQYGFYFDQDRCTSCFTCVVACRDWHDVPAGPASWIRIKTVEKGTYPDLFVSFGFQSCYHCAEPTCVSACPTNAITKRESDGIVIVDRDLCMGKDKCGMCLEACPYEAPQFGAEEDATMQKCDLCTDRCAEGKKPICVDACPMRALDAGELEELRAKYSGQDSADSFEVSEKVVPSITFRHKDDKENHAVKKITVAPARQR